MGVLGRGSNPTSTIMEFIPFHTDLMSNLKNTLPGIPRNETAWIIDRSARISGRPSIPPFEEEKVLSGLVWVSYWLTLCKVWSN